MPEGNHGNGVLNFGVSQDDMTQKSATWIAAMQMRRIGLLMRNACGMARGKRGKRVAGGEAGPSPRSVQPRASPTHAPAKPGEWK